MIRTLLDRRRLAAAVVIAATSVSACAATPQVSDSTRYAIVDVSVLPMDREAVLHHQTVLVEGQRITAVGPLDTVNVPNGATVIPGEGRFLLPGLSDMHSHLRRRKGHLPDDYLRQGVTVIRNMAGDPDHLELRAQIAAGEIAGPLFYTSGQPLTSSELFPSHRLVTNAEEGRAAVREQVEQGFDYIKVYSLLSREAFDGVAAAAKQLGVPIVGHVSDQVGLRHSLVSGMVSIEHLFGYFWELEASDSDIAGKWHPRRLFHAVEIDPNKLGAIAQLTVEAGAWNCPTLWRKNNYLTFPPAKEAWETPSLRSLAENNRRLLVRALHDAGADLLTGTDDQAQVIHEELELFVAAGLTPYETLTAATVNAARFLEATDDFGTIQVGRLANLLLLDANPLDDIRNTRNIAGVMMRGVWLPHRETAR